MFNNVLTVSTCSRHMKTIFPCVICHGHRPGTTIIKRTNLVSQEQELSLQGVMTRFVFLDSSLLETIWTN